LSKNANDESVNKYVRALLPKVGIITGTSVGGLIAAALALDVPFSELQAIFREEADTIFQKNSLFSTGSTYTNAGIVVLEIIIYFNNRIFVLYSVENNIF
jgi:hypothetical protein